MNTLTKLTIIVVASCFLSSISWSQDKNASQQKDETNSVAEQEPNVFDCLPDRFWFAILTPKIGGLEPKLHKLSKQAYPDQIDLTDNPIHHFYKEAGFDLEVSKFNRILDRSRAGAFMYSRGTSFAWDSISILPIKNLDTLAGYLEVDAEDLTNGEILETAQDKFVKYADGNLIIGQNDASLERLKESQPFRKRISKADQKRLVDSDATVVVDRETYRVLKGFFPSLAALSFSKTDLTKEDADKGVVALLKHAEDALDFLTIGVNLENGLNLKTSFHFRKNSKAKTDSLIESVRGGAGIPDLEGLPEFQFVAAFAAKGAGDQNVAAAKTMLSMIVKRISPRAQIMSAKDKTIFYESFTKLWEKMNGTRIGVYRLEEPTDEDQYAKWAAKRTGRLGAVAIFDIENPIAFLDELPGLVKFANEAAQRNTAMKDMLPIGFTYKKSASSIAGHRVDELVIETDRLSDEARWRFRYLFGDNARRFKLVPLDNHLLFYVGTSMKRLEETIANLKSGKQGLAQHPAILANYKQIDPNRKIEFHFSSANLNDLYNFKDHVSDYIAFENLSAYSVTIDSERLGMDTWLPAKEIDPASDWISSLFWLW